MRNKPIVIFLSIIMFFVGGIAGIGGFAYITLPHHEELVNNDDVYYSLSEKDDTVAIAKGVQQAESGAVAVHFLELGNKYTGDCTYIKVGENIDILIDCGSKSNSIPTVSNYLNKYVTDGVLEYVIVTHAHEDHYAGFATTTKVDSIFDLYECETIITFSNTNQRTSEEFIDKSIPSTSSKQTSTLGIISYANTEEKSVSKMYANFNRELTDELNTTLTKGVKSGQNPVHLTAVEVANNGNSGKIVLDELNNINLHVLTTKYYTESASSDNDYSVCTMISQGSKHFIFTGDLETHGEKSLIDPTVNPIFGTADFTTREYGVELYKAGHHGSKTSSSMELLNVIKPRVVCVCCCAGSSEYTPKPENQFPTKQFINNISQFTKDVYVTTMCIDYKNDEFTSFNGNIVVMAKITDVQVSVFCSNNTTKLKDTEWFKNNRLEICKKQEKDKPTLSEDWYN